MILFTTVFQFKKKQIFPFIKSFICVFWIDIFFRYLYLVCFHSQHTAVSEKKSEMKTGHRTCGAELWFSPKLDRLGTDP